MRAMRTGPDRWSADTWFPVFFFLIGILACLRLNPWQAPILLDDQVYFYISERAASGIAPHISEFDPKNALSMFATAAFIWIGRLLSMDDLLAARAASILATGGTCAALWVATRRIGGTRTMAHIAAAFPVIFGDFLTMAVAGAQPKIFLAFAIALWLLVSTMRRPFLLGITAISSFLVWQPALVMVVISPVAMVLAGERSMRVLALYIAGVLIPLGLYEAYFWWHGALEDQIYQSLFFAAEYPKSRPSFFPTIERVFGFNDAIGLRRIGLHVFGAALVLLPVAFLVSWRRTWGWFEGRADRMALAASAYATAGFCFVDYQGFPDRFFLIPSLAVTCGIVAGSAASWLAARAGSSQASIESASWRHAVPVALATLLVLSVEYRPYENRALDEQRAAATYVGSLIDRGKTVYAMGPLHLLAMNRVSNYNRFGFYPVRIRAYLNNRLKKERNLMPLRDGKLPDVLIKSRMEFPPNRRWIDRYYRPERSKVLRNQKVDIYVLREDAEPLPKSARPL